MSDSLNQASGERAEMAGRQRSEEELYQSGAGYRPLQEQTPAAHLLRALSDAAVAMEMALKRDELFAAIGEELAKSGVGCLILATSEDRTNLCLKVPSPDSAQVAAAKALAGAAWEGCSFPVRELPTFRQVVWERDTVFIEDAAAVLSQITPQIAPSAQSSPAIVAPLIVEDEVIGMLGVQSDDLSHADIPAITTFAHQLAAAWHRTGLVQEIESSLEELTQTQSKLLKAQRMEAVGRLAGGVAHDFNNLLTIIQVNAELLRQQLRRTDPLWDCAQQILEASERAASLTRQLLRFSSSEVVTPASSDLSRLVKDLSPTLGRIIGEENQLVATLADDLWAVRADPTQLEQVLVNLALNARDAMPLGGRFVIETANLILDGAATDEIEAQPGEYVLLKVSDNGTGMHESVREHLFEPFFTTKEQGRGTGLGLSTVYGIVKQCGGHISVQSQVGRGTAFHIYLPRYLEAGRQHAQRVAELPPQTTGGWETILLVEDEAIVRELALQILEASGYQVLEATSGAEALRIAREHRAPIHLLLTDVLMPEMNGRELAEQLRKQHPGMRILFTSGYDDHQIDREDLESGEIAFLPKPFSAEKLRHQVRQVLDPVP